MEVIIWIIFISTVCSLIYNVVARDYLFYNAMWSECVFPGVVIWNKLSEREFSTFSKIVITSILSALLFMHVVMVIGALIAFLACCGLEKLIGRIFKKR